MKPTFTRLLLASLMILACGVATADDRAYTEGSVLEISYVRTKPGMFDEYMKWVGTQRKAEMEALKKAGVILSYAVYNAMPRTPQEADLILVVEYKNMAALDGLEAKMRPIMEKMVGSITKAEEQAAKRGELREVIGEKLGRELILK